MTKYKGYAGKILRIDLSAGTINTIPTEPFADRYIGGRGIALKIHWDEVPADIDALDPENRLVFMTGPVCGVPGFAGSRWQVSAKSPVHDQWSYCNLGGAWGAKLKFAGYDGIVIHGKMDRLVYLYIRDNTVELRDAGHLKGKGAIPARKALNRELGEEFRVVAVGPAGENGVRFASLTGDQDSSGSGGLGAVMGNKNLKAIAVAGTGKIDVADPERVRALRKRLKEVKGPPGNWPSMLPRDQMKKILCFGCINGCMRADFITKSGDKGKYICQSAQFYEIRSQRFHGEVNEVPYLANKLCDDYGVDTRAIEAMIMWLSRCHKSGTLTEEEAGIPLSKMGSLEFIETLIKKIAFREGFGDVLAEGTLKAAETIGRDSARFITDYMAKTGEIHVYGARLYLVTGLLYAMDPRLPIQQLHQVTGMVLPWVANHLQSVAGQSRGPSRMRGYMTSDVLRAIAKRFWGDEICVDFSTYEGKGLAAVNIQDREIAKECLILCDFSYPILHSRKTENHMGEPTIESEICGAVTGMAVSEQELLRVGERVYNVQRAILTREGRKGREHDTIEEFNFTIPHRGEFGNQQGIVPGKDGEPYSRAGMVVDRDGFEKMKDDFYSLRGWDVDTGLQKREKLEALDLGDVADVLDRDGLLAQ